MQTGLEDVRSADPVERLMEDSWAAREEGPRRREVVSEIGAALLFLAVAVPMALSAGGEAMAGGRAWVVMLLIGLYAVVSRTIRFPLGAGHVVPSYLILAPMLALLPAGIVPLAATAGLVLGGLGLRVAGRGKPHHVLLSAADGWSTLGPALVLWLAGPAHGAGLIGVCAAAFLAGGLVDLASSSAREWLALGIPAHVQVRVVFVAWLIDGCAASLGLLAAQAASVHPAELVLLLPFCGLLFALERERTARIEQAHHRLELVARERTRLQAAIHRLGEAFAAKLDLHALSEVMVGGSIDALDADGGRLVVRAVQDAVSETSAPDELDRPLSAGVAAAQRTGVAQHLTIDGVDVLALPFAADDADGDGVLCVARRGRPFREDERALMRGLVDRARIAVAEVLAHAQLREQVMRDPLTGLGNRRKLAEDLGGRLLDSSEPQPLVLMLFDLNGFKSYNDTFGHVAGDALLARLGQKLSAAAACHGEAYRLGGDEFCVLTSASPPTLHATVSGAVAALAERGEEFSISASCGTVLLPHEASTPDYALQLADERMYEQKQGRRSSAGEQAQEVLLHIMQAKQPDLGGHFGAVAELAVRVGRRLRMGNEQVDELARAAALHDVGKVGVPDAILSKEGALDEHEWSFVRQHTLLGERILSAAPALRPVATIVRATHERWDGSGYPDGLRGEEIPLAARIVAVCDAYEAMIVDRAYRRARSPELAREELRREAGRQFDPAVVEAFVAELDRQDVEPARSRPAAEQDGEASYATQVVARVSALLEAPPAA